MIATLLISNCLGSWEPIVEQIVSFFSSPRRGGFNEKQQHSVCEYKIPELLVEPWK